LLVGIIVLFIYAIISHQLLIIIPSHRAES
jgi:hypothetical protein